MMRRFFGWFGLLALALASVPSLVLADGADLVEAIGDEFALNVDNIWSAAAITVGILVAMVVIGAIVRAVKKVK